MNELLCRSCGARFEPTEVRGTITERIEPPGTTHVSVRVICPHCKHEFHVSAATLGLP